MELQHKIQDSINAALATEFPGLKLPENKRVSFHLERQADGTMAFHSSDPNIAAANPATHEEVESRFAEKMFSLFGKQILSHLPPEMASQIPADLVAQLSSGNIKVFVEKKTIVRSGVQSAASPQQALQPSTPAIGNSNFLTQAASDSPITPEHSNSNGILRIVLLVAAIAGLLYFYLRFHH